MEFLFWILVLYLIFRWRKKKKEANVLVGESFAYSTFSVMGHICKADGRVSEEEIHAAQSMMREGMGMSEDACLRAEDYFRDGTRFGFDLENALEAIQPLSDLHRVFLRAQAVAACSDGTVSPSEMAILQRCCEVLDIPMYFLQDLFDEMLGPAQQGSERSSGQGLDWAYRTLEVEPSASDQDVRQAYARKMKDFHPDKLVSKGLPEDLIEFASQRTKEITKAYQQIKKSRRG